MSRKTQKTREMTIPSRGAGQTQKDERLGIRAGLACVILALSVVLIVLGAGCAATDERDLLDNPPVELETTLDKPVYLIGEAAVCTAIVRNTSDEEVSLPCPDTKGLDCYYGPLGTDIRYHRTAVRSQKDETVAMITIAPGEEFRRQFVFLRMTGAEGMFAFHAVFKPAQIVDMVGPTIIAKAALFEVKEPTLFKRDMKGLLLRKEAIRVIESRPGAVRGSATARMFRNEAGFLDWYVEVRMAPDGKPSAEPITRAFLVSPYLGGVRDEVTPLADPEKGNTGNS